MPCSQLYLILTASNRTPVRPAVSGVSVCGVRVRYAMTENVSLAFHASWLLSSADSTSDPSIPTEPRFFDRIAFFSCYDYELCG